METMSLGIEAPVKVTGTLTEFDTSNVQDFLGTNNVENKSIADGFQSIPETIGNSTDEWKANTAIVKEFGNVMPEVIKSLRQMNDAVVRNTQNLPALKKQITSEDQQQKRIEQLNRQNFLGFFNTGSNMIQNAAHGNIGGSVISGASGVSTIMNNFSQMASASDMTGLAKSLLIGGGILTGGIAIAKGGKALADAYKDAMPTIFDTGKAFGTTDSDMSMALYKDVNKFNNGTNLDNAAFNSLVVNLRKQGVGNGLASPFAQAAEAGRIAETTAQWAYATGGDANQYANLAGIMSRYGGSTNVADDFNRLVSAGYASGLNDSQIPEFLSGIQKVMEDGIAKGFARSATEVADTMLMFSKLFGNNAFWQGEQGAKLINQASAGLAGATSMSKTSDLLAFGAISRAFSTPEAMKAALGNEKDLYMNGSNYVNEMMILEQGLNKGNFGALMEGIYSSTGDDNERVEKIRSMFGLNYTGARRIQDLYDKYQGKEYDANFEKELSNITTSPENQNDETAYRKSVNKIAEALQTMGQPVFNLELKGITEIGNDVHRISEFLSKDAKTKEDEAKFQKIYSSLTKAQQQELVELMPTFTTSSEKAAYAEWYINGGVGMPENLNKTKIYSDYGSGKLKSSVRWGKGTLLDPKDLEEMPDYINQTYGSYIEDIFKEVFDGNTSMVKPFMKALETNQRFTDRVVTETKDSKVTDSEKKETVTLLRELVEQVKEGIPLNMLQ